MREQEPDLKQDKLEKRTVLDPGSPWITTTRSDDDRPPIRRRKFSIEFLYRNGSSTGTGEGQKRIRNTAQLINQNTAATGSWSIRWDLSMFTSFPLVKVIATLFWCDFKQPGRAPTASHEGLHWSLQRVGIGIPAYAQNACRGFRSMSTRPHHSSLKMLSGWGPPPGAIPPVSCT